MVACMAVMARENWTDERLDDLAKRIDQGFDSSKVEIRDLRADMDKGFGEVKAEIREVKGEIREVGDEVSELRQEMNARFDSMQRTLIACFAGLAGSIAASAIGALLATQL
jgi:ribosome recycling factor